GVARAVVKLHDALVRELRRPRPATDATARRGASVEAQRGRDALRERHVRREARGWRHGDERHRDAALARDPARLGGVARLSVAGGVVGDERAALLADGGRWREHDEVGDGEWLAHERLHLRLRGAFGVEEDTPLLVVLAD